MLHAALTGSLAPELPSVLIMACTFVCVAVQVEHRGTINQQLVLFLPLTIEKLRRNLLPHQTRFCGILDSSRYCSNPPSPRGIFPSLDV